jgi:hypothetical protein
MKKHDARRLPWLVSLVLLLLAGIAVACAPSAEDCR